MRRHSRSNALLVELLIVIMFFMLSATILLRVFAAANLQSDRARLTGQALTEAQNVAERLYTADDGEKTLADLLFTLEGEYWTLAKDGYSLKVKPSAEQTYGGQLYSYCLQAVIDEETLFTLPVSRYVEVQP